MCAHTPGEIPADRFKYGLFLQAADSLHVCERLDAKSDRVVQYVPKVHGEKINDWLNGKFWLYDNRVTESDEAESIIRVFEQAYKRHDCRVFMVDNPYDRANKQERARLLPRASGFYHQVEKIRRAIRRIRSFGGASAQDNQQHG